MSEISSKPQSQTSGLAVGSLVCGVLFIGLPAIVLGHIALRKIARSDGSLSGRGLALAGTILGYLSVVALTIIVILSGLVVGGASFVQRKAAIDRAKVQLEIFELKITEYMTDAGGFLPPTSEDDVEARSGIIIYRMLYGDGIGADGIAGTADDGALDGRPDEGAIVYWADLDPINNNQNMINKRGGEVPVAVVDPWGNPWRFRNQKGNPDQQNSHFDLWSVGPDGKNGTADDIKNW